MQAALDVLRQNLRQQHLLGEILGAHHQRGLGCASGQRQAERRQAGESLRSIHSSPSSANSAMAAAGSAPANTVGGSTMEIPRKMKNPSPPPPLAWGGGVGASGGGPPGTGRSPAIIEGAASGSSTCQRICRAVI